jgi:hypothetical protein
VLTRGVDWQIVQVSSNHAYANEVIVTTATCEHCERSQATGQVERVERLADVICCDDCAQTLLESGAVLICLECSGQAELELRKQLPPGSIDQLAGIASRLDEAAVNLEGNLARQREFEGEHAYTQLLVGGASMEAELAVCRLEEMGELLVSELLQMARLYRRIAGQE